MSNIKDKSHPLIITSKTNESIRLLRQLAQKKYRDSTGYFIIENIKTIYDAVQFGVNIHALYITEQLLKKPQALIMEIIKYSPYYVRLSEYINVYVSSLDTPSGIIAIFKKPESKVTVSESVIYLNGISDPGNMGTILRTAVAFGFHNIVVDDYCVDIFNPKTIQASKEAVFKLAIYHDSGYQFLEKIKGIMPIIGTRSQNAISIETKRINLPICLVLGNEANGISTPVVNWVDYFVSIPLSTAMESLNVSIAAGILFYWAQQFSSNS